MNDNINQSSAVSAEIAKDISVVHESSTRIAEGSSDLTANAEKLATLAQKLSGMVRDI